MKFRNEHNNSYPELSDELVVDKIVFVFLESKFRWIWIEGRGCFLEGVFIKIKEVLRVEGNDELF